MKKILVILLVLFSITGFSQKPTDIMISIHSKEFNIKKPNGDYYAKLIFKEINEYRKSKNLNSIVWDTILGNDSKKWSQYLCESDKFEHDENIEHITIGGECLTSGYSDNKTYDYNSKEVVFMWKNSRLHNSILLMSTATIGAVGIGIDCYTIVFRIGSR